MPWINGGELPAPSPTSGWHGDADVIVSPARARPSTGPLDWRTHARTPLSAAGKKQSPFGRVAASASPTVPFATTWERPNSEVTKKAFGDAGLGLPFGHARSPWKTAKTRSVCSEENTGSAAVGRDQKPLTLTTFDEDNWQREPRALIKLLIHEGLLHMCSKLMLEYEVENVELDGMRFKNTHDYDEKIHRFEHGFRRGLERSILEIGLPSTLPAADADIPIIKWCTVASKKNSMRGAFEVYLVVENIRQPARRVLLYSTLKMGEYPDARAIVQFLSSVVPRVRAAKPPREERESEAPAPRSALSVIAAHAFAEQRERSFMANAEAILRLREDERRNNLLKKIVARIMNESIFTALLRWKENVSELRDMQAKSRKIIYRMKNRVAAMMMDAWREHTVEETTKRVRLRRIVQRMLGNALSSSFVRWLEWLREFQGEQAEEERRQKLLQKVLSRITNSTVSQAYERWCDSVLEIKEMKAKSRRIIARMMNGTLVSCWDNWRSVVEEEAEKRNGMRRIMMKMLGNVLSTTFVTWFENVQYLRSFDEGQEHRERVLVRVLGRMKNRVLTVAFWSWLENSALQKQERLEAELVKETELAKTDAAVHKKRATDLEAELARQRQQAEDKSKACVIS